MYELSIDSPTCVPIKYPFAESRYCLLLEVIVKLLIVKVLKETSELDLMVAGTKDGVLMVESEAKMLSEEVMLGAVSFGHKEMQSLINEINNFAEEFGIKDYGWVKPENENEKLSKYIGKSSNELRLDLGKPNEDFKNEKGNLELVYKTKKYGIPCERRFELDSNSIVIGFVSNGCF